MRTNAFSISLLFGLLLFGGLGNTFAQTFDIASGGLPTITGAVGGSVAGSSSTNSNLSVTINFGEVSPANKNNIVKVVVPIAVRSTSPYNVTAVVTGATNVNAQAIQRTDIGFGANNMHSMGGLLARTCDESPHIFAPQFDDDPASVFFIAANGRVAYPATLNNLLTSATILSGPPLSFLTAARLSNNGYTFNAIFTITPQFYAPGTANLTVTFTILSGPNVPC
jgi:hypothetical protein